MTTKLLPMPVFNNSTAPVKPPIATIPNGPFKGVIDSRINQENTNKDGCFSPSFYPLCNEALQAETLLTIPRAERNDNSVHIGFAANFNYDLIAVRNPTYAIVSDISPLMLKYFEQLSLCVQKSSTRDEFVKNMQTTIQDNADFYYSLGKGSNISMLCNLTTELTRVGSWLSTDKGFARVKQMHEEGRILYLKLDITDKRGFKSIQDWIKREGLSVDTIYVSNIPEWLHPDNGRPTPKALDYLDNIQSLINAQTYVIDAFKSISFKTKHPEQKVTVGQIALPLYRTNVVTTKPSKLSKVKEIDSTEPVFTSPTKKLKRPAKAGDPFSTHGY
jgi:hypothetical protein